MKTITTTLGNAVIGFNNFNEAEAYALKNNGEVRAFSKKAGETMYKAGEIRFEAFTVEADDFEGEVANIVTKEYAEQYYNEEVAFLKNEIEEEELSEAIKKVEEIRNAAEAMDDDMQIVVFTNGYWEKTTRTTMEWSCDSTLYVIGVLA